MAPARFAGPDEGRSLFEVVFDPDRLVATVATALRELHASDVPDGTASTNDDLLLEEARIRVEHGAVDVEAFDEPFQRHDVARLLEVARRVRPSLPDPDPVLIHGAARLSSVRVLDDLTVAWVPSTRVGVGDPYRDLATMSIDLAARVSPQALGPFFDAYGLEQVDLARLDFHVMLDQLLR
jgi:aminoglycoside phosphotransferase